MSFEFLELWWKIIFIFYDWYFVLNFDQSFQRSNNLEYIYFYWKKKKGYFSSYISFPLGGIEIIRHFLVEKIISDLGI